MNTQTKLVFALEHVAHLHDLFEDNEFEHYLMDHLITLECELERQLANELHRKNPKLGERVQGYSNKETIKEGIGAIGRITDQES
tara:strand:+ start:549 stop:803 length:255 start_codon:yes stop_codon:yes gene_type:complete